MEAPEIFRVLGKRVSELVMPYIEKLTYLSENDSNRVVRIHAKGAIKATLMLSIPHSSILYSSQLAADSLDSTNRL